MNTNGYLAGMWVVLLAGLPLNLTGQPVLTIELEDAQTVRLFWAAAAGDFALEQTASLSSAPVWSTLPLAPAQVGAAFVVEVAVGSESRFYRLRQVAGPPPLVTVLESSPRNGESGVAVTRETIIHFTQPLAAGATIGPDRLFAEFGGRRLLSRAELSSDRRKATLFYLGLFSRICG